MANAAGTSTTLVTLGRAPYPFQPHTSNNALDQIRRAGGGYHAGVMRELGEYVRFLGAEVDASGLDHDVANWQGEYDGVAGVILIVMDPAGEVVGTAGVLGGRVLSLDTGATASRKFRTTTATREPRSGWSSGSHQEGASQWPVRQSAS